MQVSEAHGSTTWCALLQLWTNPESSSTVWHCTTSLSHTHRLAKCAPGTAGLCTPKDSPTVGAAWKVQHHVAQCLIQWGRELAKPVDALTVAQGLW